MIETTALTKTFETIQAVRDVSLSVKPGEVLALLGPNGAGKTTTIRMLTSILPPTSGTAKVAGYDVRTQSDAVRREVGVLTENHGLYLRMNGREYLDFFGEIYLIDPEKRRKRAEDLSERFGIADALDRRIGEYSKGMRQKLALVRAMIHDPAVLLLDEPTSAMDPHSARLVRNAIHDLRGDGRTVMICTHNLGEAEELADRIAIISDGRIIAEGTTLQLKEQLLGPAVIRLTLGVDASDAASIVGQFGNILAQSDHTLTYQARKAEETNPQIIRALVDSGVPVVMVSEVAQSLEEVYLRVVGAA